MVHVAQEKVIKVLGIWSSTATFRADLVGSMLRKAKQGISTSSSTPAASASHQPSVQPVAQTPVDKTKFSQGSNFISLTLLYHFILLFAFQYSSCFTVFDRPFYTLQLQFQHLYQCFEPFLACARSPDFAFLQISWQANLV